MILNKDHTFKAGYIGKDTCYVTHELKNNPIGVSDIGISGQPEITGKWSQNGNLVYLGSSHGTISISNVKTLLTQIDTVFSTVNRYAVTTVGIKTN